jgi:hypothetical protein
MRVGSARSLAAIAMLAMTAAPIQRSTVDGISFDAKVTLVGPQENAGGMALTAKGRFANGVMRIDPVIIAGNGPMVDGEYIIINESGSYAVRPADSSWIEKNVGVGTFTTMANAINRGAVIVDFATQVDSLGAGEPIDGRATRHFRVLYSFNTMRGNNTQETNNTYEYWLADLPVPMVNPFDGRTFLSGPRKLLMAELVPKLNKAWAKMGTGTAVKIVGTNGQGFTRKIDLTNVKTAQFDDSVFTIPKGFHRATPGGPGGPQ